MRVFDRIWKAVPGHKRFKYLVLLLPIINAQWKIDLIQATLRGNGSKLEKYVY